MIRLAILSGKGGTGKTSIAGSFGYLAGKNAVLCDCDVDAANLSLICGAETVHSEEYSGGTAAFISKEACKSCGICMKFCRFNAVKIQNGYYTIDESACEGCGYCSILCPSGAVTLNPVKSGDVFLSKSRFGSDLASAELQTGAENSGKLSSRVRKLADESALAKKLPFVIIDGPPGISCPAIAAISGTDYVLFVSEPTFSGISDLKRIMELAEKLNIPFGIIVNKADINPALTEEIKQLAGKKNADFLGSIPYSEFFISAVRQGKTVLEITNEDLTAGVIKNIWNNLTCKLEGKSENRV
jgi:MinD superfamily P-loop ATPase